MKKTGKIKSRKDKFVENPDKSMVLAFIYFGILMLVLVIGFIGVQRNDIAGETNARYLSEKMFETGLEGIILGVVVLGFTNFISRMEDTRNRTYKKPSSKKSKRKYK